MNDPRTFPDQAKEPASPGLGAGQHHRPAVPASRARFHLAAARHQAVQLIGSTPGSGLRPPTAQAVPPQTALEARIGSIIDGISDSQEPTAPSRTAGFAAE